MKEKYELEFSINSSPQLLYQYISDPSGLSEWFADNVNSRGEIYSFIWGDSEEKARVVTRKTDERVRYRWLDENDKETDYFFELKIHKDELTKDVTITVTDFAEPSEINESKQLWENQIMDLKQVLGSA
ncbi:SRPBCC family protein [Myroides sp. M-43]|uniref:START-like domain-containing protein n=1 Tax=Myroides oncorhynchi TaxID=2893756 RepID=UPI001E318876|nr:START-like domain-containing protein [Myroides oncorhynchi]MCC9042960.1 SRPBCC family protein [Myroides oncorhynchi]